MAKILVIDDEPQLVNDLRRSVSGEDRDILEARDETEAVRLIEQHVLDLVVVDLKLSRNEEGLGILRAAKKKDPLTEVILVTAYGTEERGVTAVMEGAFDYIDRNWPSVDYLRLLREKSKLALAARREKLRRTGGPESLRARFVNPILEALQKVQPYEASSSMAVYIDQILHTIRQMEDHLPDDPLLEVLFALYDALAFNGRWVHYKADQYAKAIEVVRRVSQQQPLQTNAVEEAIMELENIGFDTTPYPLDMEEMEEEV